MKAGRVPDWEAIRGRAILLVVYLHVGRGLMLAGVISDQGLFPFLDRVDFSFIMPLFFFIAGRFFPPSVDRYGPIQFAVSKLGTVAYPYFIWSLVQGTVEIAASGVTNRGKSPHLASIAWAPIDQFWFLYVLFFVFLIALAFWRLHRSAEISLLLVSIVLHFAPQPSDSWWILPYLTHYLLYFSLGVALRSRPLSMASRTASPCVVPLATCVLLALNAYTQDLDGFSRAVSQFLCACSGTVLVASLMSTIGPRVVSWFAKIGSRSLPIFLMHIIVASGVRIVLLKVFGTHSPLVHLILGCVLGSFIPYLAAGVAYRMGCYWIFEIHPVRPTATVAAR